MIKLDLQVTNNQGFQGEGGFDPFSGFGDFFKNRQGGKNMEEEFFADFNDFFGESKGQARTQKGQDI